MLVKVLEERTKEHRRNLNTYKYKILSEDIKYIPLNRTLLEKPIRLTSEKSAAGAPHLF